MPAHKSTSAVCCALSCFCLDVVYHWCALVVDTETVRLEISWFYSLSALQMWPCLFIGVATASRLDCWYAWNMHCDKQVRWLVHLSVRPWNFGTTSRRALFPNAVLVLAVRYQEHIDKNMFCKFEGNTVATKFQLMVRSDTWYLTTARGSRTS